MTIQYFQKQSFLIAVAGAGRLHRGPGLLLQDGVRAVQAGAAAAGEGVRGCRLLQARQRAQARPGGAHRLQGAARLQGGAQASQEYPEDAADPSVQGEW